MYIIFSIRNEVEKQLKKTLTSLKFHDTVRLEVPSDPEFGDLAFPCFQYCSTSKRSPQDTAMMILKNVQRPNGIDRMEVHGGYINFWFNAQYVLDHTLSSIIKNGETFGILSDKQKKIIVEHTSANPNGPLHVGRARNPIIGDTIARILKAAGYQVETQFYLDDLGTQVAILTWAFHHLTDDQVKASANDKPDHYAVCYYQKAYDLMNEDELIKKEIDELVHKSEHGDEEVIALGKKAYEPVLKGICESLSTINISIDTFIPESTFIKDGTVIEVISELKNTPYCHEEDGALYLDLESFGVKGRSTKFFITRSNKTSLYATRDIAYHLWKTYQADLLINVLGEDHKLESRQVEIALELLDAGKKPIPVFYSFVSLPGGKMSTRRGRVVYLDDLIEEIRLRAFEEVKKRRGDELSIEKMKAIADVVGIGALRYNIIKVQPEKDIEFKWDEALSFEGNTAPFIQYAIARCQSIFRKSTIKQTAIECQLDVSALNVDSEVKLGKKLANFPMLIHETSKGFKPHLITQYLYETASMFNQFYRDCPVINAEQSMVKIARLGLVLATKIVLENGLRLLGVDALDEM